MSIENDISYQTLRRLSLYLSCKGIRKESKKKMYLKVMIVLNNQRKVMKKVRNDFCLSKTGCGFNKNEFIKHYELFKIVKDEDFKRDEIRLFWD